MRKELLTYKDPKSPVSEVFRTLRTNIQFMSSSKKLKTLLVTSTFPEEGKSWVTSNLAVTFAQAGKRVILIDADMRKGRQYNIFGVLPRPGLSNYLSNMDAENMETTDVNIANYIQETGVDNLHILVAGNVPPNPSELLVSHKMRELLQELKEMCDLVIIDGTPCDLVTDAIILSRYVDSTIIVTAQKETKKDNLQRIVKNIQNVGGRIAGVVVNKVDISSKKYNQSYYYGSISGGNTSKSKKHSRKSDDIFTNLFKFGQDDEDEDLNKFDKIEREEHQEEIEAIKELIEKSETNSVQDEIESNQHQEPVQEPTQVIVQEPEQVVEPQIEQAQDNSQEFNVESETIEQQEQKELQEINQTIQSNSKKQYDSRNKKHRNKHKNRNRNRNYNNNNNNNYNYNYNNDTDESNLETNSQSQQIDLNDTVERAESAKDMPQDKANEIINLVNNYIEAEKKKQEQERKY